MEIPAEPQAPSEKVRLVTNPLLFFASFSVLQLFDGVWRFKFEGGGMLGVEEFC